MAQFLSLVIHTTVVEVTGLTAEVEDETSLPHLTMQRQ